MADLNNADLAALLEDSVARRCEMHHELGDADWVREAAARLRASAASGVPMIAMTPERIDAIGAALIVSQRNRARDAKGQPATWLADEGEATLEKMLAEARGERAS